MTINKDYSIDISEIKTVRLASHKCTASLILPPDIKKEPPEHCPNCGANWFGHNTVEQKQLYGLLGALRIFSERTGTNACQIKLEVSQPS